MQVIISWLVKAILDWLLSGASRMYAAYLTRKASEEENASIKKGVEDAKDDKAAQDALNRAGSKLGRRS